MDAKAKNAIIIIAAAIAVVSIGYFFLQPKGIEKLKDNWAEEGINEEYLHLDPEKVSSLGNAQLMEIRNNLVMLPDSADEETKELAGIYINYLDYLLKIKEVQEKAELLANKDFCANLAEYDKLVSAREEAHLLLSSLNSKILAFNQKYPSDSVEIKLFTSIDLEEKDLQNTNELKDAVQSFRSAC